MTASAPARLSRALLVLGPGVLVMLGENDGPSMLSYATTGATYGIGFFVPFVLLTFAMAFVVQEMTVRLGTATGRGHAELITDRFGKFWGYFAIGDLVFGNVLTLVTEFVAISAGCRYFGIAPHVAVAVAVLLIGTAFAVRGYATWERILLGLALGNLFFVPAALFAHPDGGALVRAVATWGPLPHAGATAILTLVLANVGATVTPWMVFFQQSAVVDKGLRPSGIPAARTDTAIGACVAAVIAVAAIVTTATLFAHRIDVSHFASGADFATALRPYVGGTGAALFALGMIEAGLVAAMTISTSSAYAVGEAMHARGTFGSRLDDGRWFYAAAGASVLIAAAIVSIPNAPLLAITLTVNIVATLLMAPALVFVLLLINDRELVGDLANGARANVFGGSIVIGISLLGTLYGVLAVFPNLLGS